MFVGMCMCVFVCNARVTKFPLCLFDRISNFFCGNDFDTNFNEVSFRFLWLHATNYSMPHTFHIRTNNNNNNNVGANN